MSDALIDAVKHYTDAQAGVSPFVTRIDGLTLLRADRERPPGPMIFKPSLCIVAQGSKWSRFGDRQLVYKAGQALVVSVETPAVGRVVDASPDKPYLGVIIEFDLAVMREVLEGLEAPLQGSGDARSGIFVTDFDGPLADCALRMVRLLATPQAIPMLAPLILREISYWLLTGPHGAEIARLALSGNHAQRVISAIHALRDRFAEPVRIVDLAAIAQMSASAFHRQFKLMTSMTPLQYQKQLRLLEARRLMLRDAANVETAAFQVGYESASQFSREYQRMFGMPPGRDVAMQRDRAGL